MVTERRRSGWRLSAENVARLTLRRIFWALTAPARWFTEATGAKAEAFGIRLVGAQCAGDGKEEIFFAKTTLALGLIAEHDPRWLARLQRDLRGIWLGETGNSSFCEGICVLDWDTVASQSTLYVALVIIHEGVHARMHANGVGRVGVADLTRHERAAVRQQIAFAARFPNTDRLVKWLEDGLQNPWWTRTAREERLARRVAAGTVPRWLAPVIRFGMRVMIPHDPSEG